MTFSSSMSKLDSKILIVPKVLWFLFTQLIKNSSFINHVLNKLGSMPLQIECHYSF